VIFDNIELLFPREDSDFSLVHAFQSWIQDLLDRESDSISAAAGTTSSRVMILGLTQDARGLDPSVASLFDDSIELDIPTPEERYVILKTCTLNHDMAMISSEQLSAETSALESKYSQDPLEMVSMKTHGYLAADLDALCIQAAIVTGGQGRGMDQLMVQDFWEAMKGIKVSALRQSTSVQKVDPVRWSDIGGLENVKVKKKKKHVEARLSDQVCKRKVIVDLFGLLLSFHFFSFYKKLEESVIWLYKHAEAYARMGISPSKGVLL
jgi:transitional endoplasmic reticulum ATPase